MSSSLQGKLDVFLESPITVAAAGVIAGFILGRITAPISTVKLSRGSRDDSKKLGEKSLNGVVQDGDEDGVGVGDGDGDEQGELQDFKGSDEECKLVLVVRTDLGMTKGKIAAQCSHATLACYKALLKQEKAHKKTFSMLRRWEYWGQAKVTVQVKSEDELLMLQAQAMSLGLCAKVIHDAGRTQIASGSATVLGVGPGPKSVVDQVTGGLKLL